MSYRETKFGKVFFAEDALIALDEELSVYKSRGSLVFFLVDENTHEQCLARLIPELPSLGTYEVLEVPEGEESKSLEVIGQLWSAMSELGADRTSLIVNVGGGMICDLGGFLAGTYMRGISFFHVPTSLLCMVDASLGGKTAIDVGGVKNLAGLFQKSDGVFLIPDFLDTLSERNMKSGYAEMLKHGLIHKRSHYEALVRTPPTSLVHQADLIRESMTIKMDIVEQDPKENGLRKALNFGHTLGHAIESYFLEIPSQPALLHGEAIAIGMWLETELSMRSGLLNRVEADEIQSTLLEHFAWVELPEEEESTLLHWMKFDKKSVGQVQQFTLLSSIGEAKINQTVSDHYIIEALSAWNQIKK